jgi:hypothetical protein
MFALFVGFRTNVMRPHIPKVRLFSCEYSTESCAALRGNRRATDSVPEADLGGVPESQANEPRLAQILEVLQGERHRFTILEPSAI